MTLHLGTVPAGSTLYIPFASYDTNGASVTLSGLAVTDIEIFKNGSTTQRASDAGYALLDTDGIDFDGITGIHGFSVDLSDNTDSGFYSVGAFYWVVVSAVTIDSQTVSFIAATFRVGPAEHTAGYPVVTIKDGTGTGEIDTTSGGVLVAAVANNAITAAAIANGAIDAATFAADVDAEFLSYIVDDATRIDASALNTLSGHDPGETIMGATDLGTGSGLTGIVLPSNGLSNVTAWTVAITGNITGNLSGSVGSVTGAVGSVTGAVGSVTGNVGGNVTGSVGSLATQAKADVNAEAVDALATDTYPEPGQGAPAATASIATKIGLLHKMARNKITQSSTTFSLFADDGTTVDQKSTVSDDSTVFTRGELASGP